jgi:hypothetical protein
MTNLPAQQERTPFWQTANELPSDVFDVWRKLDHALSPVAIVATVDPDGSPRAVPFGSLRAVTPQLLRLCSFHDHQTYKNMCRGGLVTVVMISPPDLSVSVVGRPRLVKEHMALDEHFAILEIDIEEVKNDMAYRIVIDNGNTIHVKDRFKAWYDAIMAEMEGQN